MVDEAERPVAGRVLVAGSAHGEVLVLDEPLSFWGGLDPASGAIIDQRHPQRGEAVTGRVLVMPGGRGSSSSSSVLAEAIRQGTGPAAILLARPDEIVVLGALVVELLDGSSCPVVVLEATDLGRIRTGDQVDVALDGRLRIRSHPPHGSQRT
jgi:uncharacterized protein